jgi:type I restriction enzyme, S subunit
MQELLTGKRRLPGFSGNWEVKPFRDLVMLRKERTDPGKSSPQRFCIELEHVEAGTGRLLGNTVTDPDSSLKSAFVEGDVLFGKLRAYLRKYWLANRSGVCSTEFWVLSPKPEVSNAYLFQLVQTDPFIETASSAYGTHMPRSDWNVVQAYRTRVPPTCDEQRAIASVLSDMDSEIVTLEAKVAKMSSIKQGMMQQLLTGKIRLI